MLTEEINQAYQSVAPFPVWFRYLITYQELDSYTGLTLGILLALVYLILKVTWFKHVLDTSGDVIFSMQRGYFNSVILYRCHLDPFNRALKCCTKILLVITTIKGSVVKKK